ncbi:c-type cytochrome [Lentibacter sp.]|uniref:c-type cytochrome n=1 Tax=Lentibacter sp. TaxID=2024994 RepID=UPI003F69E304
MTRFGVALALGATLAGAALAHDGVENEAVKARMMLMDGVKTATGTLGGMAKGEIEFDADKAGAARQALMEYAAKVPAAFEAQEMDPKSTALPAIWENWADFEAKAVAMGAAAEALDTSDLGWLQAGMGELGGTCAACHKAYRIKK